MSAAAQLAPTAAGSPLYRQKPARTQGAPTQRAHSRAREGAIAWQSACWMSTLMAGVLTGVTDTSLEVKVCAPLAVLQVAVECTTLAGA